VRLMGSHWIFVGYIYRRSVDDTYEIGGVHVLVESR